eukprot:4554561-Alexandrium_andersonii.AAC.1
MGAMPCGLAVGSPAATSPHLLKRAAGPTVDRGKLGPHWALGRQLCGTSTMVSGIRNEGVTHASREAINH